MQTLTIIREKGEIEELLEDPIFLQRTEFRKKSADGNSALIFELQNDLEDLGNLESEISGIVSKFRRMQVLRISLRISIVIDDGQHCFFLSPDFQRKMGSMGITSKFDVYC